MIKLKACMQAVKFKPGEGNPEKAVELFSKMRSIVLETDFMEVDTSLLTPPGHIALPFPVCAFESMSPHNVVYLVGDLTGTCAGGYEFAVMMLYSDFLVTDYITRGHEKYAGLVEQFRRVCAWLYQQQIATEKVNASFKIRVNGQNHFTRIREVIHVTKKKITSARGPNGGAIEYSHRFEVAGHWRIIKGIGKDREGSYGIKGFTWVKEHERGPETKPLIKKQRVFHSRGYQHE